MRVLFDLNVLLDLFLRRAPYYDHAVSLQELVEEEVIVGMVAAMSIVALRHLLERALGPERSKAAVAKVLAHFEVRSIGRAALEEAMHAEVTEYDDAVIQAAARHGRADAIVTRKPERFDASVLPVFTPPQLLEQLRTDVPWDAI